MNTSLPTGTVTFLFTDIEGSTRLAQQHRAAWEGLRQRHHAILRAAMEAEKGYLFQIIGDAFCVAFHTPAGALRAATRAQKDLHAEPWGEVPLRVRMGIHTGEAEAVDGQYRGYLAMSSVQRVVSAAHGGQVLLSQPTFELVQDDFPEDVAPRDLGPHRLKDLRHPQHLVQLVISGLPSDFPAVKTLDSHPHNLPIQLTSFVGREPEIQQVGERLQESRLVTLTGVGGTGKTRLSLQAAAEVMENFDDGAWLVELAPLSDPLLVPQAVAAALGVHEQPGRPFLDVLKDYLHPKQLLLVLDNCEHLIDACAQAADALLHAAPQLKILATSREALAISGEVAFAVRSLSLPAASAASAAEATRSEAVRLFSERAAAVQPGFTLSDQNWASVLRICSRLDGIPLALELAAARVKGLSPEQIASRLDNRFRLLTGGSRTALPRQRTLEATIDWSYKLMSEDERLLLRRLSVFAGGWNLEAAEAVCSGDGLPSDGVLDALLRAVDQSLVISDMEAMPPRYHLLETIRQFAQQRLDESGESESVRRRHAGFFGEWVEQMGMELRAGPTQLDRFAQLEVEQGNIAAALEWSLGRGDPEFGLRMVGAIFYFWWRGGHWLEWERWMTLAATQIDRGSEAARAAVLVALCGASLYIRRDNDAARLQGEAALALYRQLEDARNIGWTIFWLNTCYIPGMRDPNEYARAVALTEEALDLLREAGDMPGVAQGLTNIGLYADVHGDRVRAKTAFQESLEIARITGDQIREHILYSNLGCLAMEERDYEDALTLFKRSLIWARAHGNSPNVLSVFANLSLLWSLRGQPERAARLIGAGEAVSENSGVRLQPVEQTEYDHYVAGVREQLGGDTFDALRAEGRAMKLEQTIEYALAEQPI